jgi:hypothetical protein
LSVIRSNSVTVTKRIVQQGVRIEVSVETCIRLHGFQPSSYPHKRGPCVRVHKNQGETKSPDKNIMQQESLLVETILTN